jgi:two-component system, chemotaxis family, sensor histidine kinase and response regulator PixL
MAIHSDIRVQAYGFFVQEAPELLQIIETELLQIREERTSARVHALMRAAHSIKGGAANVGLEVIKTLAHRLEDCFRALYDEELELDDDLEALLLQGYDCLRAPLLAALEEGLEYDGSAALEAATPVFDTLTAYLGDFLRGEDRLPTVAEMGIDIAQTIFETDVAEGLARLASISPSDPVLGGELRAQAEVFLGLGELLELPGTMEIAQLTITALDRNPDHVQEIFQVALADFQAASAAVLQGDRQQGGHPSDLLRQLGQPTELHHPELAGLEFGFETNPEFTPEPNLMAGLELESAPEAYLPTIDFSLDNPAAAPSDWSWGDIDLTTQQEQVVANDITGDLWGDLSGELISAAPSFSPEQPLDDVFGDIGFASDNSSPIPERIESDLIESELTPLEPILEPGLEPTFEPESAQPFEGSAQPSLWDAFAAADAAVISGTEPEATMPVKIPYMDLYIAEAEQAQVPLPDVDISINPELETLAIAEPIPTQPKTLLEPGITPLGSTLFELQESIEELEPDPAEVDPNSPSLSEFGLDRFMFVEQRLTESDVAHLTLMEPDLEQVPQPQTTQFQATQTHKIDAPLANPKPRTGAPTTPANQLTVKLEIERLDRMNNQLGELAINRNSLSLQNSQLQDSLQEMRRRFSRFMGVGDQLKGQLGQMLISPERYARNRQEMVPNLMAAKQLTAWGQRPQQLDQSPLENEFDALELDSYNEIYNQLQEAMEMILQIEESVGDVSLFAERSNRDLVQQQRILNTLRDELMWGRMLPLSNILDGFPRMIRDLALKHKKPVDLKILGGSTLVDKAVLDKLYDPLLHLIRNAFDHGIESAEGRQQRGKAERGQIRVQAYHLGSRTIIEIQDDGKGIDYDRIRAKAVDLGLLDATQAGTASPSQLLNYLFEPGFSTASQVSELSGRGVGLDIVRGQIQALKGTINISSESGRGTTFTLQIPLTLSITKLMLIWSGSTNLALPSDSIIDIVNPQAEDLKTFGGDRFLHWQGQVIPIHNLQNLLPYNCPLSESNMDLKLGTVPTPEDWAPPLLILRQSGQPFALEVERLIGEQELVIKPFSNILNAPSYLYGCTILGDGSLVSVVDGLALLDTQRQQTSITIGKVQTPLRSAATVPTILVVDDSTAMRQTLGLSLEKAGYRVLQAKDGREALDQLQLNPHVKLVICDIEMPVMNGFEFLTQKRQQPDLAPVPVAMLTSRGGEKHRKLAMQLGAKDYFTKPYIEQQFLGRIKQLTQVAV